MSRPYRLQNLLLIILAVFAFFLTCVAQTPRQPATKSEFIVCKSTFALCTFAQCEPITTLDTTLLFSCKCEVHPDTWSAGAKPCEEEKRVPEGQLIRSRYAPNFNTYARCSNNRPWAMCLDSPCIIDKTDSDKPSSDKSKLAHAHCTCPIVQGQGDYLVQPDTDQCSSGAISSATVVDLDQITDFLETNPNLHPIDMTVVNVQPK
jgi:hypothetical protein